MIRFLRENNTNFNLNTVRSLAVQWVAALDPPTSKSYIEHVHQNENVFKQADNFVKKIEPNLDNNSTSDSDISSDSEEEGDSS